MAEQMKPCKACGKEIAKSAKVCPHCGAKQKNKVLGVVLLIVGILIFMVACSSLGGNSNKSETASKSDTNEVVVEADSKENDVEEGLDEAVDSVEEISTDEKNDEENEPEMTMGQKNAVRSARQYLKTMAFSRQGLIDQLSSEYGSGYDLEDAEFAVSYLEDNNEVDWKEQAVKSAESYVEMMGFSREGLIEQLSSEYGSQYTLEEAEYAADALGY